jgi:hypothetical protein
MSDNPNIYNGNCPECKCSHIRGDGYVEITWENCLDERDIDGRHHYGQELKCSHCEHKFWIWFLTRKGETIKVYGCYSGPDTTCV